MSDMSETLMAGTGAPQSKRRINRRRFLQAGAVGATGLTLLPHARLV